MDYLRLFTPYVVQPHYLLGYVLDKREHVRTPFEKRRAYLLSFLLRETTYSTDFVLSMSFVSHSLTSKVTL